MSNFRLKCTKIVLSWGSAPDPVLTALPQTPSWIKGGLLLREGEGVWEGKGREGEEREGKTGGGKGGGGDGKGGHPSNILLHPQFQFSRNMPGVNFLSQYAASSTSTIGPM